MPLLQLGYLNYKMYRGYFQCFLSCVGGYYSLQPVLPQTEAEAELVPEGEAGKAALEYQKLLQQVMPERQHKEFSDDDSDSSITVDAMDAAITKDKPVAETDSEADKQNDEEETGTDQNISQ